MKTNFSKILLLTILFLSKNSLSSTKNSTTECEIGTTLNESYFTFVHKKNLSDFKDGNIKTFLSKKYLPDDKTNSSYIFETTNNDIFNQALPVFRGNFSSCETSGSTECTPQDKDICQPNFKNYQTHNLGFIKDFSKIQSLQHSITDVKAKKDCTPQGKCEAKKKIKREIDLFTQKQLILKNTYLHKKNNNSCNNTIDYDCLEFEEKNPTYTATSSDDKKICILTPIDPTTLPQKCKNKIKRNFYYYCKILTNTQCDQSLLSNYKNGHSCLLIEQQQEAK